MNNISFADLIAMRNELTIRITNITKNYADMTRYQREFNDGFFDDEIKRIEEQRKTILPEYQLKLKKIDEEIDLRLNQINTTI